MTLCDKFEESCYVGTMELLVNLAHNNLVATLICQADEDIWLLLTKKRVYD